VLCHVHLLVVLWVGEKIRESDDLAVAAPP
jgi:hypothetical protein